VRASVELLTQYRIDFLNAPVVVGASGSIFGILLAFGMMFPNTMIYMYFFLPMRAKYFVILYGAIELFSGLRAVPGDNVAHFAHLGGMLFGLILLLYWRNRSGRMYH
jgi:membrane associated rhomboid family serine protease